MINEIRQLQTGQVGALDAHLYRPQQAGDPDHLKVHRDPEVDREKRRDQKAPEKNEHSTTGENYTEQERKRDQSDEAEEARQKRLAEKNRKVPIDPDPKSR